MAESKFRSFVSKVLNRRKLRGSNWLSWAVQGLPWKTCKDGGGPALDPCRLYIRYAGVYLQKHSWWQHMRTLMLSKWLWRPSQTEVVLGMPSGVDYDTLSTEAGIDAYQRRAILCFLAGSCKKLEGDCPGIAVWPFATGLACLGKVKNIRISPLSMPSCSRQRDLLKWDDWSYPRSSLRNALLRPPLPWSLRAREEGDSLMWIIVSSTISITPCSYLHRKDWIFLNGLEADRKP